MPYSLSLSLYVPRWGHRASYFCPLRSRAGSPQRKGFVCGESGSGDRAKQLDALRRSPRAMLCKVQHENMHYFTCKDSAETSCHILTSLHVLTILEQFCTAVTRTARTARPKKTRPVASLLESPGTLQGLNTLSFG